MKKLTVAISVYNVEKYISRCLDSILEQTIKDFDIICVDDGSTDKSLDILYTYKILDSRIRIISNGENKGLLVTRKIAIENTKSKYILFLDGDDTLEKETCEVILREIKDSDIDILQYGRNIINSAAIPEDEILSMERFSSPYVESIKGKDILIACFLYEKYNYNIACKVLKVEICKKAFEFIDDRKYYMGEDILGYFLIAYFSNSYRGIEDKLYNYYFGLGVSAVRVSNLESFKLRCSVAVPVLKILSFLEQEKMFWEYKEIYKKIERRFLSDNFDSWYYKLPIEYREEAKSIFINMWGKDKFILSLLYDIENKQYDINQKQIKIQEYEKKIKEYERKSKYKNFRRLFSGVTSKVKDILKSKFNAILW